MRRQLATREGQRKKFRAIFKKLGSKINYKGYSESTILLTDIVEADTDTRVSDHIWFSYTKGFEAVGLKTGSSVEFEARIKEYKKGYVNKHIRVNHQKIDYKLSHPTKIKLIP